jgi:leucyl-tRNA synthetase
LISTLMEFVNLLSERYQSGKWHTSSYFESLETLMILLAPIAPHISDELWQLTGHEGSIHIQDWLHWDEELAAEGMIQIPIQVNGRLRAVIELPRGAGELEVRKEALAQPAVQHHIDGAEIVKVIFVPDKIMNIIIG